MQRPPSVLLANSGKAHSLHPKKQKIGSKKGISNQAKAEIAVGTDALTGNATVSSTSSDALTRPDSPTIASGVKGQPDLFRYQHLSSTPFEVRNFDYADGDRIQLPGAVDDIWKQYNIQYQVTSDGVISQVMNGNQLVGIVHAQIGITSLI
jgi:hypothetical protein